MLTPGESPKRFMYSRQGKAINHLFPLYFASPIRRPDPPSPDTDSNSTTKDKEKPTQPSLSSSFKSMSREGLSYVYRDRTESPKVGAYNPNWQATRPRSAQAPRIKQKKSTTRPKRIFTPKCITKDLNCSFPKRLTGKKAELLGNYLEKLKRNVSDLQDYVNKAHEKSAAVEKVPSEKIIRNFVEFDKQVERKEFVTEKDPPNEQRFAFGGTDSGVFSKNKKVRTYFFEKASGRKQLFESRLTLGPYNKDEEKLMPKMNVTQVEFAKMTDRKDLILDHMLTTPMSADLADYDRAFNKQSCVRGVIEIPKMATVTPRDDIMYRTTEAYCLNVPVIQSAESPIKISESTSIRFLKTQLLNTL